MHLLAYPEGKQRRVGVRPNPQRCFDYARLSERPQHLVRGEYRVLFGMVFAFAISPADLDEAAITCAVVRRPTTNPEHITAGTKLVMFGRYARLLFRREVEPTVVIGDGQIRTGLQLRHVD